MTPYHMKPGTPSAHIQLHSGSTAWICANTPPQLLTRERDGSVLIPAGQRVTIGANYVANGYRYSVTCSASVSIVPETGAAYYQDLELEGSRCRALIFRKTDDRRIGLAFDRSLAEGGAGCTKHEEAVRQDDRH
jgi:hypothetical protein